MTELKSCPFCGGNVEIRWHNANGYYSIVCSNCCLEVVDSLAPTRMPKEALIGFYNKRVKE